MAGIGRPPLDPVKRAAWEIKRAERAANKSGKVGTTTVVVKSIVPVVKETKEDMVKNTSERFDALTQVTRAACMGGVRSVVVTGAGGVGKSYQIENIVSAAEDEYGIHAEIIHGVLTPISLYKLLYSNRTENDVIVLDDADGIFFDEKALTILKAALDTNKVRNVSWMSESNALKTDEGETIPKKFEYCGTMIFITNLPLHLMAQGNHKNANHLAALMTRALYIDLKLQTSNQIVAWIEFLVKKANILVAEHGLSKDQQTEVVAYLNDNVDHLRDVSIRTAIQIAGMMKTNETGWKNLAKVILWK
jgi:hypothetical protein